MDLPFISVLATLLGLVIIPLVGYVIANRYRAIDRADELEESINDNNTHIEVLEAQFNLINQSILRIDNNLIQLLELINKCK